MNSTLFKQRLGLVLRVPVRRSRLSIQGAHGAAPASRNGRNGCFAVGARHQGGANFSVGARSRSRMEESGPPRVHNEKSRTALARNTGKIFACQDCGYFVLLSAASRERGESSGRMALGMGCGSPICAERCQRFRFVARQSKHVGEVTRGSCDVVAPPKTRLDLKRETLGELEAMLTEDSVRVGALDWH